VVEQGTHKPLVGGSNPPAATSPHPLDRLADALLRGARRLRIRDDAPMVLAVSGGPDSVALLHAAVQVRQTDAAHWPLTVAHLDHALRPNSADDARFVNETADALGVPVEVRRADVAALARAEGRSLEDAGREARYRFLEEVASRLGETALIATAHTADDSAETILLNLARGTGLTGLRGIPPRRGRVVRPLLGERRATLRAALDAAGTTYRLDPSNADPAHARNRVRAELLPALERINPAVVETLSRFGRLRAEPSATPRRRDRLARAAASGAGPAGAAPRHRRAQSIGGASGGVARGRGGAARGPGDRAGRWTNGIGEGKNPSHRLTRWYVACVSTSTGTDLPFVAGRR
jgi:tRNA(Ile)-lysidine synthetase-like protein